MTADETYEHTAAEAYPLRVPLPWRHDSYLETDELRLVPLIPSVHALTLFQDWGADSDSVYLRQPMSTPKTYKEFLTQIQIFRKSMGALILVILDTTRNLVAGITSLANINPQQLSVEMGISMSPLFQGKGIAKRACALLMRYVLEPPDHGGLGYRRLTYVTSQVNSKSQGLAQYLGFTLEMILRFGQCLPRDKAPLIEELPADCDYGTPQAGGARHRYIYATTFQDWQDGVRERAVAISSATPLRLVNAVVEKTAVQSKLTVAPTSLHEDTARNDYPWSCVLPFRPDETLEGPGVRLEPFIPSIHGKSCYDAWKPDWDAVYRHRASSPPDSYVDFLQDVEKRRRDSHQLFLAVLDTSAHAAGLVAGEIALWNINPEALSADMFIALGSHYQGKGLAKRACALLMRYVLDPQSRGGLGFRRLVYSAQTFNAASLALVHSLGFKLEGTARHLEVVSLSKAPWADTIPVDSIYGTPTAGLSRSHAVHSMTWQDWIGQRDRTNALLQGRD